MPKEIENEDGTKETVYGEDEVRDLKAGHDANLAKKEELAAAKKELEENKKELAKLQNKDFNFKKLRDMNEEERAKLTEAEKSLMAKSEELEENQNKFTTQLVDSYKNEAIAVHVGDDSEMKKKVLANYDRIVGSAVTKEEVYARMRDAFNMVGSGAGAPNPLATNHSIGGGFAPIPGGSKGGKLSPEEKDLGKKLGLTDEEMKGS